MHFQWDGPNTAVLTPVDRLWWLILHTTPLGSRSGTGCYGITSNIPPNSPKYVSNAFTTEMCWQMTHNISVTRRDKRWRTTYRKPSATADLMVTWPMTSRDPKQWRYNAVINFVSLLANNGYKCRRKNDNYCQIEHSNGTCTSFHRTYF